MFNEYVIESIVVDQDGNVVEAQTEGNMEDGTAFKLNLKEQLYNKSTGEPYQMPLYVINKDGQKLYIFPMLGSGLWGNIYGNMALNEDLSTVYGVTFSHDKETPGLGAEITEPFFTDQFISKELFDDNGEFTSIQVVKGGASTLPAAQQIHGVDAISGGTITSVGVDDMIRDVIGAYLPYIEKQRKS
jgi:Na+-transporting NADH:ubiquinone oxidoreductase subunit C